MKPISATIRGMKRSGIREILDLASAMPDVIHLEIGQPDFPTPAHITEAAHQAALDGYTQYTPNAGLPSLREAIVRKLRERNGMTASVENVVVTPGSVFAMAASLLALAEPGEEVLVPDPGWPNYEMMLTCQRFVARPYPLCKESGFLPDIAALPELVTPRTKAIIVNSPSNPCGVVLPRETVRELVGFADEHDLYVLSDEIYEDIVFEGEHVSPATFDRDGRVLSVFGFSKSYAMTGWRVGYVMAPQSIAAEIIKLQEAYVSSAPSVSQKAAEAALTGPQDCVWRMAEAYRRRRDAVCDCLREHGLFDYEPTGAFYILIDISRTGLTSREFCLELLSEKQVAVAPGDTFGQVGEGSVRISLAKNDGELAEGIKRVCGHILTRP